MCMYAGTLAPQTFMVEVAFLGQVVFDVLGPIIIPIIRIVRDATLRSHM